MRFPAVSPLRISSVSMKPLTDKRATHFPVSFQQESERIQQKLKRFQELINSPKKRNG